MAHESFEDEDTAAIMNDLFINIKVDREERPDIDQIYMSALHAIGEQGGWPLTMFLTPQGEPFFGGTYFPPKPQYGRPSFINVMEAVVRTYKSDRERIETNRAAIQSHLMRDTNTTRSKELTEQHIHGAADSLMKLMDEEVGGTRGAPKFPQAGMQQFLLSYAKEYNSEPVSNIVEKTQRSISQGGIYDHLAGGIARYTVDANWLIPHFEKMLYDNGQYLSLLGQLLDTESGVLFRRRIEKTSNFILSDMKHDEGGFFSSYDADSEGKEGKFYTFSEDEIFHTLGDKAEQYCKDYGINAHGNWEGTNILNRPLNSSISESIEVEDKHSDLSNELLLYRNKRIRPGLDDKILTDWTALAAHGLATAYITLKTEAYLDAAIQAVEFLLKPFDQQGELAHSYKEGEYLFPAMATDYANLISTCLLLFKVTQDQKWISISEKLNEKLNQDFWSEGLGFYFLSSSTATDLIMRPKATQDEATPAATGTMISNLVALNALTGNSAHLNQADTILHSVSESMLANVFQTASFWHGFLNRLKHKTVVIVGEEQMPTDTHISLATNPLISVLKLPDTSSLSPDHPAYGKTKIGDQTTAYICQNGTCSLPITDLNQIAI